MPALYRRPFPLLRRGFPFFLRARVELDSPAYIGPHKHAVDFLVPEGTPVCVPRDGIIIELKDDSDRGGPDEAFADDDNYIVLRHTIHGSVIKGDSREEWRIVEPTEERSVLIHLKCGSARVKVGDRMCAGQIIALQGSTDWTYEPHIHMTVYHRGESVPITFTSPWN